MYDEIIKDLEEIYQQHGVNIKFGPKSYKITNAEDEVILMEDLKLQNFKNADRLKGFDIKQTELVLKKLAQFHAASVKRVQQKGKFVEIFNAGLYSEKSRVMFEMNKLFAPDYLACVREYKGSEEYYDKIVSFK